MWKRFLAWWNHRRDMRELERKIAEQKVATLLEENLWYRRQNEIREKLVAAELEEKSHAATLRNKYFLYFNVETKRDYMDVVTHITNGIVGNLDGHMSDEQIAKQACDCADAIFAEVDKRWAAKQELKK